MMGETRTVWVNPPLTDEERWELAKAVRRIWPKTKWKIAKIERRAGGYAEIAVTWKAAE